ncbi:MAG: MogA/MoaB family molybdenum cofactor biosynthesis protein [Bacillota bacterium]
MFSVGILTLSDSRFDSNERDLSGELLEKRISKIGGKVKYKKILPDEKKLIISTLKSLTDKLKIDLVLTTGGTGLSSRDVTPEATLDIIDKEIPGISETIRNKSLEKTPKAMLSRGVSGIRNKTLIINLPGSPKAVDECMDIVKPVIKHSIDLIKGNVDNCARK